MVVLCTLIDDDIFQLEISVHDVVFVQIVHPLENFLNNDETFGLAGQSVFFEILQEIDSLAEIEDDVDVVFALEHLVETHHSLVLVFAQNVDFVEEVFLVVIFFKKDFFGEHFDCVFLEGLQRANLVHFGEVPLSDDFFCFEEMVEKNLHAMFFEVVVPQLDSTLFWVENLLVHTHSHELEHPVFSPLVKGAFDAHKRVLHVDGKTNFLVFAFPEVKHRVVQFYIHFHEFRVFQIRRLVFLEIKRISNDQFSF